MAFDIVKGMFGIDPSATAKTEDQQAEEQAIRFAQLDPDQSIRASGMLSGHRLGKGLVNLAGGLMGADMRDPQQKIQAAMENVQRRIAAGGVNVNDPASYGPLLIEEFQKMGLTQQAYLASQQLAEYNLKLRKQGVDEAELRLKAAELADKIAQPKTTWYQQGLATGKLTPASVKKYLETKDIGDIELQGPERGQYSVVKADGKVYMIHNQDPSKREEIGVDTESASKATRNPAAVAAQYNALIDKHRKSPGESTKEVIERMRKGNPNDHALALALAREAVGADNIDALTGGSTKLTDAQQKGALQASASIRAVQDFDKQYGQMKSPVKMQEVQSILTELESAAGKERDIPASVALRKIADPVQRDYIISVARMAYPRLRLETGAAISGVEWANVLRNILPYFEDKEDTVNIKLGKAYDDARDLVLLTSGHAGGKDFLERAFPDIKNFDEAIPRRSAQSEKAKLQAAGRAAKAKGDDAYRAWVGTLTPQEKALLQKR